MRSSTVAGLLVGGILAALLGAPATAGAAVPHTVLPGETLWSIAYANNFTTRALAAYNGLSEDAPLYAGETIQIPTESEAASALAAAAPASSSTSATSAAGGVPHTVEPGESLWSIAAANGIPEAALAQANGLSPDALLYVGQTIRVPAAGGAPAAAAGVPLGAIWSPWGTMYLRSDAAAAWNELRQASLEQYGVDLYPEGPLGAYRTYDQQAQLYSAFLAGTGPPADPPGQSEHNLGIAVDLATPEMRSIVDAIGSAYGWVKVSAPGEWWHVTYVG